MINSLFCLHFYHSPQDPSILIYIHAILHIQAKAKCVISCFRTFIIKDAANSRNPPWWRKNIQPETEAYDFVGFL